MLSKESKIRVLENFYALDYIFFGKPLIKLESCCPILEEEYLSVKGALMSVFIEMLKLVEHSPAKIEEKLVTEDIHKLARESAKRARKNCKQIVTTEKARDNIKSEVRSALEEGKDISGLINEKVREKAFRLAVDSLLVARTVTESENIDTLNEWEGKIVEDSYKILRDGLCEAATLILSDE
ncbi:MAG: hypothetical protein PVG65_01115 [Candidatus Thorarchaeota archaeon]|jgi:hypothetical protein